MDHNNKDPQSVNVFVIANTSIISIIYTEKILDELQCRVKVEKQWKCIYKLVKILQEIRK